MPFATATAVPIMALADTVADTVADTAADTVADTVADILSPAFAWVLRTSWQASVAVALVLAVHWLLGRRLPARWRYALWLLVAVRLLSPALPSSNFSVFNLFGDRLASNTVGTPPTDQPAATVNPAPAPQPPNVHITYSVRPPQRTGQTDVADVTVAEAGLRSTPRQRTNDWRPLAAAVWLAGAVALAARLAWVNVRFALRLSCLPPCNDPALANLLRDCAREIGLRRLPTLLLVPDDSNGPALWGLFRPKLLIPAATARRLSPDELRFVLLHELAHLKRLDVLAEWLMAAVQVVHWFNPALWLACARCRADRELACDAAVLAAAGPQRRAEYGRTILKLVEALAAGTDRRRRLPRSAAAVGILQGRTQLRRRIHMIARSDRKPARWPWVLAALALAALGLTDARKVVANDADTPAATSERRAPQGEERRPGADGTVTEDAPLPPAKDGEAAPDAEAADEDVMELRLFSLEDVALPPREGGSEAPDAARPGPTAAEVAAAVVDLIRSTIEPDRWDGDWQVVADDRTGTVIVQAPRRVQRQVSS